MTNKVVTIIKTIFNPKLPVRFIKWIPHFLKDCYLVLGFFILLLMFLVGKVYSVFTKLPLVGRVFSVFRVFWIAKTSKIYSILIEKIEGTRDFEVKRTYLIKLAFNNLMIKKTRSFITILGMSTGVGVVVLLLSLGYGIEKLIVSRVASLEELRMADVSIGENTSMRLNQEALKKIQKIDNVETTIPLISLVGRVSYNRAKTDVLVYAATKDYMKISNVKVIKGAIFEDVQAYFDQSTKSVAGAQTEVKRGGYGQKVSDYEVFFNVLHGSSVIAWSDCSRDSQILGYVVRMEGGYKGSEYWGSQYYPSDGQGREAYDYQNKEFLGKWIKAKVLLNNQMADGSYVPVLDDTGRPKWENVCLQEKNIQKTDEIKFASVLGISDQSSESALLALASGSASGSSGISPDSFVISTSSSGTEYVELKSSTDIVAKEQEEIDFKGGVSGKVVVTAGLLDLLDIPVDKALNTKFKISFIVVKNLMPEVKGKVLTKEREYQVVGVTDDTESQHLYIPFGDMQKLGISNFSQLKIVAKDKDDLPAIRKKIETMGFRTSSAVDTVSQIESLFANLRIILGLLGMVALAVASLGMFNTLTVSLLERTREIGGMKTIGMVSREVQELFLAEAMIMGLGGGLGGLLMGYLAGKLISSMISVVSITSGLGYLDLAFVPFFLVVFIIISSFIVGILTGLYPARRAKKISALNALRYE